VQNATAGAGKKLPKQAWAVGFNLECKI